MGAWGTGPFDDDDAGDWSSELEDGGTEVVATALTGAAGDSAVVAAAAIVAHVWGAPVDLDEDGEEWVTGQSREIRRALGKSAVAAVTTVVGESELRELWDESGDDTWLRETTKMRDRLQAALQAS